VWCSGNLRLLETYRSKARQTQLFHQRKTQLPKVGCHRFGVVADLGPFHQQQENIPAASQDYSFFQALCAMLKLISRIGWGTPHEKHPPPDYYRSRT
jgi:hypothetical protein